MKKIIYSTMTLRLPVLEMDALDILADKLATAKTDIIRAALKDYAKKVEKENRKP